MQTRSLPRRDGRAPRARFMASPNQGRQAF
jgi:hypothetical protein